MQVNLEQKKQIAQAMADDLKMRQAQDKTYGQSTHSRFLDINPATYSRVASGDYEKVLSNLEWVRIAKKLFVDLSGVGWKTAKTAVYEFVTAQLTGCQRDSISAINCDIVGIGKTHAAELYSKLHPHVIYVKCEESITRADLIRRIAQNMGLDNTGKISAIRERIELHIHGMDKPLIILDDAGYMNDRCWMAIKGIYDATEYECGLYIIGDTSLKQKMERLIHTDKNGWQALFDRFNRKYQAISELYESEGEVAAMRKECAIQILELNLPNAGQQVKKEIMNIAGLSLRVLRKEIAKRKRAA